MIGTLPYEKAQSLVIANFMSTAGALTPEHINTEDYTTEMDAVGAAVALANARIPELRPEFDMNALKGANGVRLRTVQFNAYDVNDLPEIADSLADPNDAFMQSRFHNGAIGGWQPNWFRPQIIWNGTNILRSISKGAFGSPGDRSVGLPLPFCKEFYLDLGPYSSLRVMAPAYQRIGSVIQPYAIQCVMDFILY